MGTTRRILDQLTKFLFIDTSVARRRRRERDE